MEIPPVMVLSADAGDQEPERTDVELLELDWRESSSAIVALSSVSRRLKTGTAVLAMTAPFPISAVKARSRGSMAVLRMLARYFDLPFRKDVLRRILDDQLHRDESGQGIGLLQLAAIADLMGLRASQLDVTDAQVGRLRL